MKAEITFNQLWANPSVRDFFFRSQSEATLNELMERTTEFSSDVCDSIEDYAGCADLDLDDIEEMFYEETVEELAEEFGIELEVEE